MDKASLLSLLETAVEVGLPAVINSVKAFEKNTITEDDVQELKDLVKKPETYFHK